MGKNDAHSGPVWRFLRQSDVRVPWKKPFFEPHEKKGGQCRKYIRNQTALLGPT